MVNHDAYKKMCVSLGGAGAMAAMLAVMPTGLVSSEMYRPLSWLHGNALGAQAWCGATDDLWAQCRAR